jgi:hypothetical protein
VRRLGMIGGKEPSMLYPRSSTALSGARTSVSRRRFLLG